MKVNTLILLFLCSFFCFAQEDRTMLKGRLLYRNNNIVAANVMNTTAKANTITDSEGSFEIPVRVGDEITFSSVQHKIRTVKITPEIIKNKRLVVSVNERITFLDEVVVGPENQEKFLDLKKEEFTSVDYTQDKSTRLVNRAADDRQLANGLNIVNVAKLVSRLLVNAKKDKSKKLIPSEILPYLFDDEFFENILGLNPEQTQDFIHVMDDKLPTKTLFKKDKEFQLIDYLIKESTLYKESLQ